ncbi:hypothetical protein Tco_0083816 [Tanacetum coccineum]
MSLLMILWDSRLMMNTRMIRFMNGTKMCHGYTKNHGLTLEYGLNPLQLCIVVSPLIIKMDVQSCLPVAGEKMDILKEEALRNKAIMEGLINEDVESNDKDDERHELCGNETHELPVCNIRRFDMIKYSFGQDEEYVAVKENEYEDSTSTSEDACQAYQEIFRMIDEGWMDLAEKKSTMLVKYLQSGNLEVLES